MGSAQLLSSLLCLTRFYSLAILTYKLIKVMMIPKRLYVGKSVHSPTNVYVIRGRLLALPHSSRHDKHLAVQGRAGQISFLHSHTVI